jgi:hypothetical protein
MEKMMISYKDMTFCSAECANLSCHRNLTEAEREKAIKWWGSEDFPIALSDFSNVCDKYIRSE